MSAPNNTEDTLRQREEDFDQSLELAKAGFENAQSRIALFDTKAGAALGLVVLLLPVPLVLIGWLSGLAGDIGTRCRLVCTESPVLAGMVVLLLLGGWIAAAVAMFWGIRCLIPRGAKGHDRAGPFLNEWRPNILFPMFFQKVGEQETMTLARLKRLREGVSKQFVIEEYEHQLEQLGRILGEKFIAMKRCFIGLKVVLLFYAAGFVLGLILLLPSMLGQ